MASSSSGHSCPPAETKPPLKEYPPVPRWIHGALKQAVASLAPSPPATPPPGRLTAAKQPEVPRGQPVALGPEQPAIGGKQLQTPMTIQQLKVKKNLREGKCDHWQHLAMQSVEPSSSSRPLVATVGTGAPSSRPLAASGSHQAGDPTTLGRDVAEHVERQRRTSGAWKPSSTAMVRMPASCCIRHKMQEELGPQLEGQEPGMLTSIKTGDSTDFKALSIPLVGNNPQKIGDTLEKALEEHPFVCRKSIVRRVQRNGMHRLVFTEMHNSCWVLFLLAMPEPPVWDEVWNSEDVPIHFVAVLQKYNTMLKLTDAESCTLGNLLCSLTGHQPPWPDAMGGINSDDPNVGNDLARAQAKHESEPSAIGDVSVRDSSGPFNFGDDVPADSGSEEEAAPESDAEPDADYDVDEHESLSPLADAGAEDEIRTPEDDPHHDVDPDRGGGDLL